MYVIFARKVVLSGVRFRRTAVRARIGRLVNSVKCFTSSTHFWNQFGCPESEAVRQDEVLVEAAGAAGVQMVWRGTEFRPEAQDFGLPVRRNCKTARLVLATV